MTRKAVTDPGKNRKRRFNAPIHERRKHLSAPLSPPLKAEHGSRSMPVRKGDIVTLTKGDKRLTEGRVTRVSSSSGVLFIEGVTRQKLDGSTAQIPIKAENTMITKLELGDERRRRALERRGYESERGQKTGG